MSKYLHYFEAEERFRDYYDSTKSTYKEPWASYVNENELVKYNKTEEEKEEDIAEKYRTPLTFKVLSNGRFTWQAYDNDDDVLYFQYSLDGGSTWLTANTAIAYYGGWDISVTKGDTVMLRANNQDYYNNGRSPLNITCDFEVEGNMMSMFDKTNFSGITEIPSGFSSSMQIFFKKRARLISAKNLLLPATALTYGCYSGMFAGCSNLKEGPKLPATTLTENCYYGMFSGCTSLTTAPELPATSLAYGCYQYMFQGCTSLTQAPELPATSLADDCYQYMFAGCRSLTQAPELPATRLAPHSYQDMFNGCTGLTVTPVFCATTLANYCCEGMFRNCSRLVTIHSLPATSVTTGCYQYMFAGCTSLTTAPELLATTLANNCYQYMFSGCRSLTQAPELPAPTLVNYSYRGMFNGCTKLNYIKCLATNISATESHNYWVTGVASSGTFVKAAGISESTWGRGTSGIPTNWTVQDAS